MSFTVQYFPEGRHGLSLEELRVLMMSCDAGSMEGLEYDSTKNEADKYLITLHEKVVALPK